MASISRFRLFSAAVLEPFVRVVGALAGLTGVDTDGAESVMRGGIIGGRSRWRISRGVRFVGPLRKIQIGQNVVFYGSTYLNSNGPNGFISIGADSHIDQFCVLYGQGGIEIGSDCAVASGVIVYSQTNADQLKDGTAVARQPTVYKKVSIGDRCWLGAGVRVLPGVSIGSGAHIGAGAVVTRSLPPACTAVGMPARPAGDKG
jgi:acetyltransferase-like isoleucine patch superfamily enzyme